ncbi:hypothetical protein E4N77_05170 [Treponema denticola]|nr:hypothetical protein E4N77_05170 [Treponema denticola]
MNLQNKIRNRHNITKKGLDVKSKIRYYLTIFKEIKGN